MIEIALKNSIKKHELSLYSIYDLLGDVGGLLDLLLIAFAVFAGPYNQQLLNFNVIKGLFKFDN